MLGICTWELISPLLTGTMQVLIGVLSPPGQWVFGHFSVSYWIHWSVVFNFNVGLLHLKAGFVRQVKGTASGSGWDRLYQISYFFGFFVALLVFWGLHTAFPVDRQTGDSPFIMELHNNMRESGNGHLTGSNKRVFVVVDNEKNSIV